LGTREITQCLQTKNGGHSYGTEGKGGGTRDATSVVVDLSKGGWRDFYTRTGEAYSIRTVIRKFISKKTFGMREGRTVLRIMQRGFLPTKLLSGEKRGNRRVLSTTTEGWGDLFKRRRKGGGNKKKTLLHASFVASQKKKKKKKDNFGLIANRSTRHIGERSKEHSHKIVRTLVHILQYILTPYSI